MATLNEDSFLFFKNMLAMWGTKNAQVLIIHILLKR